MAGQSLAMIHIRKQKKSRTKQSRSTDQTLFSYDNFIYIIAVLAPITNIPQLLKVWIEQDASGVSVVSWFLFSAISLCWLFYGVKHKDKHLILMNSALMIIQAAIAIGAYRFGGGY